VLRSPHQTRRLVALVVACVGLVAALAAPSYALDNFCGPGYIGGNGYCNSGGFIDQRLSVEDASANDTGYAIYRATGQSPGSPSASGDEYWCASCFYILQDFHCNPGYAASHNRHSYAVYVNYTRWNQLACYA
jgi:hypothetical protein